jgi:hypothetical protein
MTLDVPTISRTVFLSGPIRGVPRPQAVEWRRRAVALLSPSFAVLNPLRGREGGETLPNPSVAVQRDKADILRSDIVLVNDSVREASMIGTAMEVMFAWEHRKLVVVFGAAHFPDYWLDGHSHVRFDRLEESIECLQAHFRD